jgi:heme-degrading monooxygenase HmoA
MRYARPHSHAAGRREAAQLSRRRQVPLIAVIFEVWPHPEHRSAYLDLAAELRPHLADIDGFVSVERFESLTEPGKLLSLSVWRDEAALAAWRNLAAHRSAQAKGRAGIFSDYRLRVAGVIRDYGMTDREAAPADSRRLHDRPGAGADVS